MKLFPDTDSAELPSEAYEAELAAMDQTIERLLAGWMKLQFYGDGKWYWARPGLNAIPFGSGIR